MGSEAPGHFRFNSDVGVFPFDGRTPEPSLVCEISRSGGGCSRLVVPRRIIEALRLLDGQRTSAEAYAAASARGAAPASSLERFHRFLEDVGLPRGLVVRGGTTPSVVAAANRRRFYLSVRVQLASPQRVRSITSPLTGLFSRGGISALLAWGLVTHVAFWWFGHSTSADLASLSGADVPLVVLLTMLPAIIHEIGHATAAARFGCRNVAIGFGVYYQLMVFYTDLSEAWRLPRRQRAVVDAAGMLFQFAAAGILALLALWFRRPALAVGVTLVDLMIAASADPFFRMDGYWLLSDIIGVADLRGETQRTLESIVARISGRSRPADARRMQAPAGVLLVYLAASIIFFTYTTYVLFVRWLPGLLRWFTTVGSQFHSAAHSSGASIVALLMLLIDVTWRAAALVGIILYARRIARLGLRLAVQLPGRTRARKALEQNV